MGGSEPRELEDSVPAPGHASGDAPDRGVRLALAPMDGVTDWAFRDLLTRLSRDPQRTGANAIDWCVSEFVRINERPVSAKVLRRACPELDDGGRTRAGVPVHLQLLGGQPEPIAETARLAADLGASGIDLNFGCPAKTVNRHDGGASLLRDPARLERIVGAVRRAVDPALAVSAKIRTGWDDHGSVQRLARAAEAGGASWLTVHGRTRAEGYGPAANWEAVGEARAAVAIPVVANGDLNSPLALARCRTVSGCESFMLGRGAMARPQIFVELRGWSGTAPLPLAEVLLRHAELLVAHRAADGFVVRRTKQWLCLAARIDARLRPLFESIKRLQELEPCLQALST